MKKNTSLLLGSVLLLTGNVEASKIPIQTQKVTEIVAYLDHHINTGDFNLLYDYNPIANISVYGIHTTSLNWDVSYLYANCDSFYETKNHLTVRDSGGKLLTVLNYTCSER